MRTIDRLTDPRARTITTVWTTDLRVKEDTYDAGTVRVALTTSHDKDGKRLRSHLNREVLTDSGIVTFMIVLYGPASADQGITLATESMSRFNAAKARAFHDFVLTSVERFLADETRAPGVARELESLIANAERVAA